MSRSTLPLALLVSTALLLDVTGCKREPPPTEEAEASTPPPAEAGQEPQTIAEVVEPPPPPLELSQTAPIIVHIAAPEETLEGLRIFVPELPPARELIETLIEQAQGGDSGTAIAAAIDPRRPWDIASAEGELVVRLPVLRRHTRLLSSALADLPAAGKLGAVDLRRGTAPGPSRALLDKKAMVLTLASSDRGLVTGAELPATYGERPLRIELDGEQVRPLVPGFRFDSLKIGGTGPLDFEATATGVSPELLERLEVLQPGALTGLLESDRIAMGASSRYRDHEQKVEELLTTVKAAMKISSQSSLVRPSLEDLHRRTGRVLGHWNGRTVMGLGPANHLLLALGAEDPAKMRSETVSLLQDVASKLELAHSLVSGLPLPRVRFQLVKAVGAGNPISVFALEDARKHLPASYAPLIDGKGDLRVAMAFSERMGAAVVVVGANAHSVLSAWLEDTAKATAAAESLDDVLSATLAIGPTALLPVLQEGADPFTLLGLSADRPRTLAVFSRRDTTVGVRVKGPTPI